MQTRANEAVLVVHNNGGNQEAPFAMDVFRKQPFQNPDGTLIKPLLQSVREPSRNEEILNAYEFSDK